MDPQLHRLIGTRGFELMNLVRRQLCRAKRKAAYLSRKMASKRISSVDNVMTVA
jgi:hypothetical protein